MASTGAGLTMLYYMIGLVCQTFVYGIYATLISLSTFYMMTKPFKTAIRKFIFIASLFMFFICTLYWIIRTIRFGKYFHGFFILDPPSPPPLTDPTNRMEVILSAICIINYVLSDCTVLWRAWVLCSLDCKNLLYIPLFFLFLFTGTCTATIVIRVVLESTRFGPTGEEIPALTRAINVCQIANLVCSLMVNISATLIVALKTWRHRQLIKKDLDFGHKRTRGEKALILLVETGLLYCIGGVMILLFSIIRIPTGGTLGALYSPIHFQLAGMYPIIVLLLVSRGMTLEQSSLHFKTVVALSGSNLNVGSGRLEPLRFQPTVVASQIRSNSMDFEP